MRLKSQLTLRSQRRRIAPLAIVAAVAATGLLSLSMSGALSTFTASIANPTNTTASGTLELSEAHAATTCLSDDGSNVISAANTNNCSTIDDYGTHTAMLPGVPTGGQTIVIKNVGTTDAHSLVLTPANCTSATVATEAGSALDFCAKTFITIQELSATKCLLPIDGAAACPTIPTSTSSLTSIQSQAISLATTDWAPGTERTFVINLMLDGAAGNAYQNIKAAQALSWVLAS